MLFMRAPFFSPQFHLLAQDMVVVGVHLTAGPRVLWGCNMGNSRSGLSLGQGPCPPGFILQGIGAGCATDVIITPSLTMDDGLSQVATLVELVDTLDSGPENGCRVKVLVFHGADPDSILGTAYGPLQE